MGDTIRAATPFSMQLAVWYQRIFLWGLSLMFLPASVQGYLAMAEDTLGPMPLAQLFIVVAVVAVIWAVIAVLVTLVALGLAGLVRRGGAGQGLAAQGFGERFSRWYRRIFMWGPGIVFLGLTVQGYLQARLEQGWVGLMTPLLIQMTVLAVVWSVLAVLVTLVALGLYRAVRRQKAA